MPLKKSLWAIIVFALCGAGCDETGSGADPVPDTSTDDTGVDVPEDVGPTSTPLPPAGAYATYDTHPEAPAHSAGHVAGQRRD